MTALAFRSGDRVVFVGEPVHQDDPPTGAIGEVIEELFDDGRTGVRLGVTVQFGQGHYAVCSDGELEPAA